MIYRLEIEIPGLPRMTNPSGKSGHWFIKKQEAIKWKGLVAWYVRAAGPSPIPLPLERAKLILIRYSSVSPDYDGLVSGFKHPIDGLVKAGVLVNDRVANIGYPEYRWEKVKGGQGKIRMIIEPILEASA